MPLSPTATRELLARLGHQPKRFLGQNFLVDGNIVRVTCSALGKIKELGVARSRFSYGGKAEQRAQLEKHILELVARGILVRLAELAREKYGGWKVSR